MTNPATPPPENKGRGCFFYGCLTCLVLMVIVCVMAFFAVRFVRNRINDYTQATPMKLPGVEMPDAEFKQLEGRVKSFGEALDQGKPIEPLVLTERDVNALIVNAPNTKELADKVYVSLSGDQIKGQVSLPLTGLGWLAGERPLSQRRCHFQCVAGERGVDRHRARSASARDAAPGFCHEPGAPAKPRQGCLQGSEARRSHPQIGKHQGGGRTGDHQGADAELELGEASPEARGLRRVRFEGEFTF